MVDDSVPTPPLHGRSKELEIGRQLIAEACHGAGSSLLLEGEAGIGKTRLLDELSSWGARRDARVLRAAAQEFERERPFGVLLDVLGDLVAGRLGLGELRQGTNRASLDIAEPTLRYQAIDATIDLVEELALIGPLLIAIDDLHWADATSVITLHRLLRRLRPLGVCLFATARPAPRSEDLARLVETVGYRLRLDPLSGGEVHQILTDVLGTDPGPRLVRAAAGAGGNPLYVTELARGLLREGALHQIDGVVDIEQPATPPSLRLVITRALSHLSVETLDVLRVASILGTSFSVTDLARVLGRPVASIVPQLGEAAAAEVLHEDADRLAFRHDLVRDAVYNDLAVAVRKALHAEAGRALAAEGRPAALVATHFAIGAEPGDAEAVSWLRRAAEETRSTDPVLAVRLLRDALGLVAETDPHRDEIATELVEGLLVSQGGPACEPIAREVLARQPAAELEWRLQIALLRSLFGQSRHSESLDQIGLLQARPDLTTQQRVILLVLRSQALFLGMGDMDGGIREAEAALELTRRSPGGDALAPLYTLCVIAYFCGDLEASIAYGIEAKAALERLGITGEGASARIPDIALPLADADRLEDAESIVRSLRSESVRLGLAASLPHAHFYAGAGRYLAGDWDSALAELEAGLELGEELGNPFRRPSTCAFLARIYGHREDAAGVGRLTEMLEADVRDGSVSGYEIYISMWAQGFLALCGGDLARADRLISGAWQVVTGAGAVAHYRLLGPDYVRIKIASGKRQEAAAAVELVDEAARRAGDVATANGTALLCRGLVDEDPHVLLKAVEEYRRGPRPMELAFACEDAGVALHSVGRKAEAVPLLEEALRAFEAVGATREVRRVEAHLRALGTRPKGRGRRARPASGWESLTPAEIAVVSLVCEGLTNKQVAERLFLSWRTVETHTGHIRAKLGVTTRTELVARFADRVRRQSGK